MRDLVVVEEDFLERPPLVVGVEGEALCALAMVGGWVVVAFVGGLGGKPRGAFSLYLGVAMMGVVE